MNYRLTAMQAALLRGLRTLLEQALGGGFEANSIIIDQIRSDSWASLTFLGERHEMTLRLLLPPAATVGLANRLCALADAAPPAVPGAFVAEMAFAAEPAGGGDVILQVEALTLQE